MKRWIASVLTACFLLPGAAMAEGVLADGWQEASTDALVDAKTAISRQIATNLANAACDAEGMTISGSGLDITDTYTLPQGIWRRVITAPTADYDDIVTFTVNSENEKVKIDDRIVAMPVRADSPDGLIVDYACIETDSDWTISYTPITMDGTIEASGNGGYVSNFFTCTKPTKVTFNCKLREGYSTLFDVKLYPITNSGFFSIYSSEKLVHEWVESTGSEFTGIIKPEDKYAAYLLVISCDQNVEWSITAK
jgi:hypothetical protein